MGDLTTFNCTCSDNTGQKIPSTQDVMWLLALDGKTTTAEGDVLGGCCSDGRPKCGCTALSCEDACIVYGVCYTKDPRTGEPATESTCAGARGTWCPKDATK